MARGSRILRAGAVALALLLTATVVWRLVDAEGVDREGPVRAVGAPALGQTVSSSPLASPQPSPGIRVVSAVDAPTPVAAPAAEQVRALAVEVVDASGLPLEGVVLTLVDVRDDSEFAQELTDAAGRARLELEGTDFAKPATFRVGAPCVRTTPPYVEFAADAWPADLVRLVAGPTGRVELSFESGAAYPIGRGAHTYLNVDFQRCGADARGLHDAHLGRELVERTIVFAHVSLGLCFKAGSWTPGLEFGRVAFDGPRSGGEVVRVEFPLDEVLVRVSGRVVDPAGAPCPDHVVVVRPADPSERELFEVDAGPDGRFVGFVRARVAARAGPRIALRAAKGGATERTGFATWPGLDGVSHEGHASVELGDIVVEALPRLVSGRVLDADGEPPEPWRSVRIEIRPLDPRYPGSWGSTDAEIDYDGTFAIGLDIELQRFELRARTFDRLMSTPIAAVSGAEGVVLRLRAGVRAEGRVLVPADVDPVALDLEFQCVAPPDSPNHRVGSYEQMNDGRFMTRALEPGRYSIAVSFSDTELGRREFDVPFVDTLDVPPVTIEPFDLRELVHAISIRVVGRDGSVVGSGTAYDVTAGDDSTRSPLDREGRVVLCATTRVRDVVFASPGLVTQRFDGVVTGAVLTLEPGPAVRVHVKGLPPAPEGWAYEVELQPQGEEPLVELSQPALEKLDASGFATLRAPCAGPFTLSASIRRTGARDSHVFASIAGRVESRPGEPSPVLELEPDPADVRGTLARVTPR